MKKVKKDKKIKNGIVYLHRNKINGLCYVGITSNSGAIKDKDGRLSRWKSGICKNKNHPGSYLKNEWFGKHIIMYGYDNFFNDDIWSHEILEDNIESWRELCNKELFYINKYHATYNLNDGLVSDYRWKSMVYYWIAYDIDLESILKLAYEDKNYQYYNEFYNVCYIFQDSLNKDEIEKAMTMIFNGVKDVYNIIYSEREKEWEEERKKKYETKRG